MDFMLNKVSIMLLCLNFEKSFLNFNFCFSTQNISEAKRRQREAQDRLLRLQRERRERDGNDKDQFPGGASRYPK